MILSFGTAGAEQIDEARTVRGTDFFKMLWMCAFAVIGTAVQALCRLFDGADPADGYNSTGSPAW